MGKNLLSLRAFGYLLVLLSLLSFLSFIYRGDWHKPCYTEERLPSRSSNRSIDLLLFPLAWNKIPFEYSKPPPKILKIGVIVKKWAQTFRAGGLERHALTLHLALAKRGHELHIFTTTSSPASFPKYPFRNLHFHLSEPTSGGYLDQAVLWSQLIAVNLTVKPFDVVHTESVGLMHTRAKNLSNLAVSWHGIAYETLHSDIIQELLRNPDERQSPVFKERVTKVVDEVRFFPRYTHHVATSDHAGDILKRIYMIPEERVHIVLNGVDDDVFKPDIAKGREFKRTFGIPESKRLILGIAGRLVKDKGHPLIYRALQQVFSANSSIFNSIAVLVAGDGPWGTRYRDLGENVIVLGPLDQSQLSQFYNAIDIFVNPTLRAQGLDHTLLEAMLSGKPVMATRLASITGSIVVGNQVGYTFSPKVDSLTRELYQVWNDGRYLLVKKGHAARERALKLFTATKMALAYERLFLCMSDKSKDSRESFCKYRTQLDQLDLDSLFS